MCSILDPTLTPLIISIASLVIALMSLGFAVHSWRQTNRPLLTARITTHDGGNCGISLNLLVENTGNRPARDVQLIALKSHVQAASIQSCIPKDAHRCFFSHITIPVLANGRSASNAFWHLGREDSWRAGAEIPVTIKYADLSGRHFSSKVRLFLADDAGFAQSFWESSSGAKG